MSGSLELRLGNPGHGGFCVARHDGRVVFVRHGLPGELVRAVVTEDRGGSFCRADAVEVLEASPDRIEPLCPVSGPGGAGCCDFSHATPEAQRALKATVVAEQLRRIAHMDWDGTVEEISPGSTIGWRTRVNLAVDADGRPGQRRYRGTDIVTDLRCPQPVAGALDGVAEQLWTPGSELRVVVDGDGIRHVVELAPAKLSRTAKTSPGRRGAAARRAATAAARRERVREGSGRVHEQVAGRRWEFAATGFWQAHRDAAQRYSDTVAEWAQLSAGDTAVDLYCGVGVFAARLGAAVGPQGRVVGVESAASAVADGIAALADLGQVELRAQRVERVLSELPVDPAVMVLDPPRAGAGREVIAALAAQRAQRVVHIGCDPAAFARDIGLYTGHGYRLVELRAFDAFPLTHHVECLALLQR